MKDINNKNDSFFKKIRQWLDGVYKQELKEKLYSAFKSKVEINDLSKKLLVKCSE